VDNKKDGKGLLLFANGDKFEGKFRDDLFNGNGTYTTADGRVTFGKWKNNLQLI